MAISLAIVALSVIGTAIGFLMVMRATHARVESLERELSDLRKELSPAIRGFNQLAERSTALVSAAEGEAQEYLALSRRIRTDLAGVVQRGRRRLADFEAVADVVQEEVEDSAMQLTTALRTVRSGAGMVGRLRRLVSPRRRRRR